MLLKICLITFVASVAYGQRLCRSPMYGSSGLFRFPNNLGCPNNFQWDKTLNQGHHIKFNVTVLQRGHGVVLVEKRTYFGRFNIHKMIFLHNVGSTEVVLNPPYHVIRVVLLGKPANFQVNYQVFFCPHPGPEVVSHSCEGNRNRRNSKCYFQCKQPEYFPRKPQYMGIQSSICGYNGKWIPDPTSKCMSLKSFEEACYIKKNCQFKEHELASFFHTDDSDLPIPELEKSVRTAPQNNGINCSQTELPNNGPNNGPNNIQIDPPYTGPNGPPIPNLYNHQTPNSESNSIQINSPRDSLQVDPSNPDLYNPGPPAPPTPNNNLQVDPPQNGGNSQPGGSPETGHYSSAPPSVGCKVQQDQPSVRFRYNWKKLCKLDTKICSKKKHITDFDYNCSIFPTDGFKKLCMICRFIMVGCGSSATRLI